MVDNQRQLELCIRFHRGNWVSNMSKGNPNLNDEPWVFFMIEEFISICIDVAHKILDAFGSLIKNKLWGSQWLDR